MLENAIKAYGGTVIFVSHDRHFIKSLATRILYLSEDGPEFFNGDYDYFEWKLEEKEARFKVEKTKKVTDDKPKASLSHDESKQRRNRLKNLERESERLMAEIDELTRKKDGLDGEIAKPENYSDARKISALIAEKEAIEKEIGEKEERWMEISEEIEDGKDS